MCMHHIHKDYLCEFEKFNKKRKNRKSCLNAAVIIETRPTWQLPLVIKNFAALNEDFNYYLVGTQETINFTKKHIKNLEYFLIKRDNHTSFISFYNYLLKKQSFWKMFEEENILIFQTDALALRPIETKAFDFDFIGAVCGHLSQDLSIFDMNGGCSLRKKKPLLECLRDYDGKNIEPEDVFFTRRMRDMGCKLPTFDECQLFSVESAFKDNEIYPSCIHGTDKFYLSTKQIKKWIQ